VKLNRSSSGKNKHFRHAPVMLTLPRICAHAGDHDVDETAPDEPMMNHDNVRGALETRDVWNDGTEQNFQALPTLPTLRASGYRIEKPPNAVAPASPSRDIRRHAYQGAAYDGDWLLCVKAHQRVPVQFLHRMKITGGVVEDGDGVVSTLIDNGSSVSFEEGALAFARYGSLVRVGKSGLTVTYRATTRYAYQGSAYDGEWLLSFKEAELAAHPSLHRLKIKGNVVWDGDDMGGTLIDDGNNVTFEQAALTFDRNGKLVRIGTSGLTSTYMQIMPPSALPSRPRPRQMNRPQGHHSA
jgi:hypothetical protein